MRNGSRAWLVTVFAFSCLPTEVVDVDGEDSSEGAGCVAAACACPLRYRDRDGDDFGDPERAEQICGEAQPGFVANGDDCYDGNADARPGQLSAFHVDRGDGSFDYDCDGVEALVPDRSAQCQPWPLCEPGPIAGTGWVGERPDCGEKGAFMHDCDHNFDTSWCRREVNRQADAHCR